MCVCVYVCVFVCASLFGLVSVCLWEMGDFVCKCMCLCVYVCVFVCVCE